MLSHCDFSSNSLAVDGASFQPEDGLFLGPSHPLRALFVCVIKAVQVKQSVNNVKLKLTSERAFKAASVAKRSFDADENLTVLKCDYICGSSFVHESAVQCRHSSVGNEQY
jgi:hypothetical protein